MSLRKSSTVLAAGLMACLSPSPALADDTESAAFPQPLAIDPMPNVAELPATYPDNWVILHDFNFNAMSDGRAVIVDIDADNFNYKGMVPVVHMGNVLSSNAKGEIYVAETYYSRMDRGERTDVISIWDMGTLAHKGEVVLPDGVRMQGVTVTNNFQFVNDGKWLAVYNFSPAQSVTIVDIASQSVLSTLDTPGCTSIYPMTGARFATLCSDGTVSTFSLDSAAQVLSVKTSEVVNTIDNDPMFMMPAMVGDKAWFLTFLGNLKAVDLSGEMADVVETHSLVGGGNEVAGYRPTGWQTIASDKSGKLYVLMNPDGKEGSHKNPASEVWIFDTVSGEKVGEFDLAAPSISVATTGQSTPQLVVARADGQIDVYDPQTGALKKTLGASIAFNPMVVQAVGQ